MKNLDTAKIKNIVLTGHSGCGKTALAEALLYRAGVIDRIGKSADGNTVCDFDPEEIKRKYSINLSLASFEYSDYKINLLDVPGLLDFAAATNEGLYAGDTVIICVSAKSGVHVGTIKAYQAAKKLNKHILFVVTKIDDPNQDFYTVLNSLKEHFGASVCPVIVPEIDGIEIEVPDANHVIIKGMDKQKVGQFAADTRKKRPPEPYKGKGIRYQGEFVRIKEGKTGAK